jgi:hypothetical protein
MFFAEWLKKIESVSIPTGRTKQFTDKRKFNG